MKRLTLLLLVLTGVGVGAATTLAQDAGGVNLSSDRAAATGTVQSALEYNRTNQSSTWVDPDAGVSGTTTPVRTFEGVAGKPCREFKTTIVIGGQEEQGYGTACRQPDGNWQIVDKTALAASGRNLVAPPPSTVYLYSQPSWPTYSRYGYDPAWGYWLWPPLLFSFDYGYRGGYGGYGHWGHYGARDRYDGHSGGNRGHDFSGGDHGHGGWHGGGGGHRGRR